MTADAAWNGEEEFALSDLLQYGPLLLQQNITDTLPVPKQHGLFR